MSLISRIRKQVAVYWQPTQRQDHYGRYPLATPVEIGCRWDDMKNPDDGSSATVYTDRELQVDGYLFKGSLRDIGSLDVDPATLRGAHHITNIQSIPNLRNTETLFIAKL